MLTKLHGVVTQNAATLILVTFRIPNPVLRIGSALWEHGACAAADATSLISVGEAEILGRRRRLGDDIKMEDI